MYLFPKRLSRSAICGSVSGSAATSAAQDLGLLGRELLLGEDALRLQVGQLLELSDLLVARVLGRRRRGVRLLFWRVLRLLLLRPAPGLAAGDVVGHVGRRAGDHRRARDSAK